MLKVKVEPVPVDAEEETLDDTYKRLVDNSAAVIFTVDNNNIIRFLNKNAFELFGVLPDNFFKHTNKEWFDLIAIKDRESIKKAVLEHQRTIASFEEEFRIVNYVTGKERWLLAKLIPLKKRRASRLGWLLY